MLFDSASLSLFAFLNALCQRIWSRDCPMDSNHCNVQAGSPSDDVDPDGCASTCVIRTVEPQSFQNWSIKTIVLELIVPNCLYPIGVHFISLGPDTLRKQALAVDAHRIETFRYFLISNVSIKTLSIDRLKSNRSVNCRATWRNGIYRETPQRKREREREGERERERKRATDWTYESFWPHD